MPTIWVDADACPVVIKEILTRGAIRCQIPLTFVANQVIKTRPSPYIKSIRVGAGFDKADDKIVQVMAPGDLVITSDIPLADEVITKGGLALNPRGELLTKDNIKAKLNMRDFADTLRSSGIVTGGPKALDQGNRQAFANELDKWLARNKAG